MVSYPDNFTVPSKEYLEKIADGMIRYNMEQIEESQTALADALFDVRWDVGPDSFNEMTDYLGMNRGEAQSYLNVGLTAFVHAVEAMEEEEALDK